MHFIRFSAQIPLHNIPQKNLLNHRVVLAVVVVAVVAHAFYCSMSESFRYQSMFQLCAYRHAAFERTQMDCIVAICDRWWSILLLLFYMLLLMLHLFLRRFVFGQSSYNWSVFLNLNKFFVPCSPLAQKYACNCTLFGGIKSTASHIPAYRRMPWEIKWVW